MKSGLTLIPRPYLSKDTTDFESVWVEIENKNGKNYLFCCAYRHPSTSFDTFSEHLQEVLSIGAVSNKQVFILGDFSLMKYDELSTSVQPYFSLCFFHFFLFLTSSIYIPCVRFTLLVFMKMKELTSNLQSTNCLPLFALLSSFYQLPCTLSSFTK